MSQACHLLSISITCRTHLYSETPIYHVTITVQGLSRTYCTSVSLIVACKQLMATGNAVMRNIHSAVKVAVDGNWMRWLWKKKMLLQEKKLMNRAEFKAIHHALVLMTSSPL